MNQDEIGRRLADAFEAQARANVPDAAPVPPPRFADVDATADPTTDPTPGPPAEVTDLRDAPRHRRESARESRRRRWVAPLAAAAAVLVVGTGAVVFANRDQAPPPVAAPDTTAATSASTSGPADAAPGTVRVTTLNSDGVIYGVGMPVIAFFSQRITDGRKFQAATTATANGKPLTVAWYFQRSASGRGPVEGQLRPKDYWPANATIRVTFPAAGTAMGSGLSTDGRLRSLMFRTGPEQVATVNDRTHRLVLTVDGKPEGSFPVSLGASATRTRKGVKVIMEKDPTVSLNGPTFSRENVKDAQRLTYDGEYLHAAPWNVNNIRAGIDTSNGCTNLLPADATRLYKTLRVGDIVTYANANGPSMQVAQGYGLWNMPWDEWRKGGLIPTR